MFKEGSNIYRSSHKKKNNICITSDLLWPFVQIFSRKSSYFLFFTTRKKSNTYCIVGALSDEIAIINAVNQYPIQHNYVHFAQNSHKIFQVLLRVKFSQGIFPPKTLKII